VDPVPDPLLRKSGSAGNRTGLRVLAREIFSLLHTFQNDEFEWIGKDAVVASSSVMPVVA
jgi:hypothetical protein